MTSDNSDCKIEGAQPREMHKAMKPVQFSFTYLSHVFYEVYFFGICCQLFLERIGKVYLGFQCTVV